MRLDEKDKRYIDLLMEEKQRKDDAKPWVLWVLVFILGQLALYLVNHEILTGVFSIIFGVLGILAVLGSIFFLSTRPFGRSNTSLVARIFFSD